MKMVNSKVAPPTTVHNGDRLQVNSITRLRSRLMVTNVRTRKKNPIYSRRSTCIRENLSRDRIQGICVAGPERISIAETFGKLLLFAQQNLVCEEGVQ